MTDHGTPPARPTAPRRRGPSRRVRLRRTIAATVVLLLAVVVTVRLVTRGENSAQQPTALTTTTRPTTPPSTRAAAPSNEDGSAKGEKVAAVTSVPQKGNGKIAVVEVPRVGNDVGGREVRYTVELEGGLGVDPSELATTVQTVLLDPKGWQKVDGVRFVNVTPEESAAGAHVDIRVTLASPGLTDKLCAPMQTLSQVSCWNGSRSVLNYRRWALGDDSYGKDVARYRIYQVNHEVGHGLGHQHRSCPAAGQRAPVMVQQTLGLGGCKPWPYPSGA